MSLFTVSGQKFVLDQASVERSVGGVLPDPVRDHYVIVGGRRYPPKQVLACATGLDRADFTTHQARRILKRLGFTAARASTPAATGGERGGERLQGGRQAEALRPYVGQWVALADPTDVLVAADTPQEVLAWLSRHNRRAPYGMFRVPRFQTEAEGAAPS